MEHRDERIIGVPRLQRRSFVARSFGHIVLVMPARDEARFTPGDGNPDRG